MTCSHACWVISLVPRPFARTWVQGKHGTVPSSQPTYTILRLVAVYHLSWVCIVNNYFTENQGIFAIKPQ